MRNIHERVIKARLELVGNLFDELGSDKDRLWPNDRWPPMRLNRSLGVGAVGGHGPIRYAVEEYVPGRRVMFRFLVPRGFVGTHTFEAEAVGQGRVRIRHALAMTARGLDGALWFVVLRPLHDALIEDALDRAEFWAGGRLLAVRRWSLRVRFLRWAMRRGAG